MKMNRGRPHPAGQRGKQGAQMGHGNYTPPADYPWPLDTIERNYRAVCYHEAGHLVVLRHFGCLGAIRINPPVYSDPSKTPFSGCVRPASLPDDPNARRIIGLAGVAAECLQEIPNLDACELADWLEIQGIEFSEADAEMAAGYQQHHLDYVVRLLRSKWQQVEEAAFWVLSKWPGGDA